MNRQQLVKEIFTKKTFLCVGLDTDINKIPDFLKNDKNAILSSTRPSSTPPLLIAWHISQTWRSMNAMALMASMPLRER